MTWDRFPKSRYVSFSQLELGVYDAVANFNIGRKAGLILNGHIILCTEKTAVAGAF